MESTVRQLCRDLLFPTILQEQAVDTLRFLCRTHVPLFAARSSNEILLCIVYAVCKANEFPLTFRQLIAHAQQLVWKVSPDIIDFYNKKFVPESREFLAQFSTNTASVKPEPIKASCSASVSTAASSACSTENPNSPTATVRSPLSPAPQKRRSRSFDSTRSQNRFSPYHSPSRKIPNTNFYLSPLLCRSPFADGADLTPVKTMTWSLGESPSQQLQLMNLKLNSPTPGHVSTFKPRIMNASKRLDFDDEGSRPVLSDTMRRKLARIVGVCPNLQ
eukprot:GILK01005796.1.p1 GENE.GILK01005796.1~~GILK01005796.1.p1  ORF type:complete len:322 (+),score=11.46 GILK01005796.1:142-966(+)